MTENIVEIEPMIRIEQLKMRTIKVRTIDNNFREFQSLLVSCRSLKMNMMVNRIINILERT